jgi:hypothetical protein
MIPANNHPEIDRLIHLKKHLGGMTMSKLISCQFNIDTACVELVFDDEITLRFKQLKVLGISDEFEIRVFEDFVDSVKKNKKYFLRVSENTLSRRLYSEGVN